MFMVIMYNKYPIYVLSRFVNSGAFEILKNVILVKIYRLYIKYTLARAPRDRAPRRTSKSSIRNTWTYFPLPWLSFDRNLKVIFTWFKILWKKILKAANAVVHMPEKFQFKMFCILSYIYKKMIMSIYFWRFLKSLYSDPHFCYFCVVSNTQYS
jgi:hypothetical protein